MGEENIGLKYVNSLASRNRMRHDFYSLLRCPASVAGGYTGRCGARLNSGTRTPLSLWICALIFAALRWIISSREYLTIGYFFPSTIAYPSEPTPKAVLLSPSADPSPTSIQEHIDCCSVMSLLWYVMLLRIVYLYIYY